MKRVFNFMLTSLYALTLMILALFMFWEAYAKDYVETYIKDNYGDIIIQTSNDVKLIKNFKIFDNDDTGG